MWFDLRLLGLAMRNQAVSEVFDDFRPWMLAGFAIMFLTGFLGREGWTKRQFQPGDQITITVFPSKAGAPVGVVDRTHPIMANGKEAVKANAGNVD